MTLVNNELTLSDDERDLLTRCVSFENGNEPASRIGEGAPQGIVRLTNKRFFILVSRKAFLRYLQKG
jgi:hypothetical protein